MPSETLAAPPADRGPHMTEFELLLTGAAVFAGATASIVGFGIGSLLTPLLASRVGMDVAIAAVALPHAAATTLRAWRLRRSIDWRVLSRFGVVSAAGGGLGALLYARLGSQALTRALAALLLVTAVAGFTEWINRWRPHGQAVWMLGLLSGLFGGVAGNQGGIRVAAMGAFRLEPAALVATATAVGVLVDAVRTPVYLVRAGASLEPVADWVVLATAGAIAGTLLGERLLLGLTPRAFRRVLSVAIGVLGIWLLVGAR